MRKIIILIACMSFMLFGCSQKTTEVESKEETKVEVTKPEVTTPEVVEPEIIEPEIPENSKISPFTGLYVDENIADTRPIAVTINNLHKALPQSGLSQADIIYEALAEGGITRFVGIFQDYSSEKIGPVRSAREYFTHFALDNDAIYIHHGGSPTGYSTISSRGLDHLDGMKNTVAFFRDQERMNTSGMYEHSSYIKSSGVAKSIEEFDKNLDKKPMFLFDQEEITPKDDAKEILIPYSDYQVSSFAYQDGKYLRYQSGKPQIDDETGEQLAFSNVIVQFADTKVVDSVGRRTINLVTSGKGILFKNGEQTNVSWEKTSDSSPTKWTVDGKDMSLTKGKTFICVVPTSQKVLINEGIK